MDQLLNNFNYALEVVNGWLWHDYVLYVILGTGLLFLIWSKFSPFVSLTHGVLVTAGRYDKKNEPGAISHFQALSAALSATVGLGNIGGVSVAVALGGPGAVFWMWVVGFIGMALKLTEVTQAMLFRQIDKNGEPHGGAMFVARDGFKEKFPRLPWIGQLIGVIFCITLLVSTITGGNMFQAWNTALVTEQNFSIPQILSGTIMAILTALVIIGGIKRIGHVAATLIPIMCVLYFAAAVYVVIVKFDMIPEIIRLIFANAFSKSEAQGAFIGGTAGYGFMVGMKRALFSNEAGQGSAPIAHSAARTKEPVREGIVSGLEPFIDTIVICTLTAFVILASGAWNRPADYMFPETPEVISLGEGNWTIKDMVVPETVNWEKVSTVFVLFATEEKNESTGNNLQPLYGKAEKSDDGSYLITWSTISSLSAPALADGGIYAQYVGAGLTSYAFDRVGNGLGRWLVTIGCWLFAISTVISWSYYGEQAILFMFGSRWITSYRIIYCVLLVVATSGFIQTERELDNLSGLGTGVMLFANIPIMLIFGKKAMDNYHDYIRRLRQGKFKPTA